MERQPHPLGPSADGARIIVSIAGLTVITAALLIAALCAWGAL